MSEIMRLIPFSNIIRWALAEYREKGSVFGIRKEKFYRNNSGNCITMFGDKISSPVGPAAGPHSQLAQNIIAAYLSGARFIELKTVQPMDGEALRKCIARPCINAQDEGYNVEWSTELTVEEAFDEYVKAWFAIQVLAKEWGISPKRDFAFNMSVGYDLEGIQSPKIDNYIEGMKDASKTLIWEECHAYLKSRLPRFDHVDETFLNGIESRICSSITLSTLHGCPPFEIEKIASYLLSEKNVHTYIKCNPTLLGYEDARSIVDEMGYGYLSFDDHHFKNDMQYADAIKIMQALLELSKEQGLGFGVKLTNTFPVKIANDELPGEEMYMSGRPLYPLSLAVAVKLTNEFGGKLPISFSGGADYFNIEKLFGTGIRPITIATTLLKPGGYERMFQLANQLEPLMLQQLADVNPDKLSTLSKDAQKDFRHIKASRHVKSRKTESLLPLTDCFKAPCKDGGCPIEQQIPEYLEEVSKGNYREAMNIITVDNACPAITGAICSHACQTKCTRIDYDDSLAIRNAKGLASSNAQETFTQALSAVVLKTNKKVAVIGAGPGGIATATYLRRNGISVTVLEQREKPFGIVTYVIPDFRVSADVIQRDYEMALKQGVIFQFGVDPQYNLEELKKEYDYIVLATGAWKEGDIPVKVGGKFIMDALAFLEESKKNKLQVPLGRSVAVIGGGDVAMDAARAAKKAPGVKEVTIVYRRTTEWMPALQEEIELALADNAKIVELLSPLNYDGRHLVCEEMLLTEPDASGRKGIKGTGKTRTLQFDNVIGAVGSRVCTELFEQNNIELDSKGKAVLSPHNETSVQHVYMVGDCKAGPSSIVQAMADGKTAAKAILADMGLEHDFKRVEQDFLLSPLYAKKGELIAATKDNTDASRCLSCQTLCEICCDVCPNRANVAVSIKGFKDTHQIIHVDGMCNECGNCGTFCPHTGNPYRDKMTLYWTEEDLEETANKGFLKLEGSRFKVKLEDGTVTEYTMGEQNIPGHFAAAIEAVMKDYPYLFAY